MVEGYTLGIALFAAIGTFLFGFDTGIATTSMFVPCLQLSLRDLIILSAIAHQSWVVYMEHPSNGLTGAVS